MIDTSVLIWLIPTMVATGLLYSLGSSRSLWRWRRIIGELATGLLVATLPFLFVLSLPIFLRLSLSLIHIWLIVLGVRLFFGRLDNKFLQTSTKFNAVLAMGLLLGVLLAWITLSPLQPANRAQLLVVAAMAISLILAILFVYQVVWTLKHYKLRKLQKNLTLKDLPTVTLAIPARNETHALTECLTAATASDYPKLEILVLDDCSQDKTSQLIRSFAHDGVRFIQGDQPAEGWLGKNQACKVLAEHASGEYIIFVGVDTRFSPQSIRKLITYALSNNAAMVSVLPQNREGIHPSTVLQQLRYYWQIVLPMTKRRVAVATQCWLIRADALRQLGSFEAVKHKIVPEGSFARRLFGVDMYRFIISNAELGITTAKRWNSQLDSALRFLYPTFKRQPFFVLLGCMALTVALLGPFIVTLTLALSQNTLWWVTATISGLFWVSYVLVTIRTNPRTWLLTSLCFVLSLVQELVLIVLSMMLYEFGEVNWKGRNVCYPVIVASALSHVPQARSARPRATSD